MDVEETRRSRVYSLMIAMAIVISIQTVQGSMGSDSYMKGPRI